MHPYEAIGHLAVIMLKGLTNFNTQFKFHIMLRIALLWMQMMHILTNVISGYRF